MNRYRYLKMATLFFVTVSAIGIGCTKLDQKLKGTLTPKDAANAFNASLFLKTAYNDVGGPYSDIGGDVSPLEDVSGDESVVPTRATDWDDNGEWRGLHQHNWPVDDGDQKFINTWNDLNKINFDATNVLTFNPTVEQAAEARFLRALSLYQLLDLFGQFPFRNPGDNLLNAPKVYRGDSAVQFIISELTEILPQLDAGNSISQANPDAARMLLMKTYLNRGAFLNRASPTFDDADMQQVITLGTAIMTSGKYSYSSNYFDNFNPSNSGSKEAIFACPNTAGVTANNTGIQNRWWPTLHYNQYTPLNPQAGWNGFATTAQFYNSFAVNDVPITETAADTLLKDRRIGGRFYEGCTDMSGVRPGLLIGQQYNEHGAKIYDRKNNLMIFLPNMAANLKENDPATLEITGIRVIKYPPDYTQGVTSYNTAGNWLMLFRYPDVVLMVAEAKMRAASADNAGALALVNELRAARGANPLTTMPLVNTSDVYDPTTLLAERGRELYWECVRRTDLIRFGVFLNAWAYKNADATSTFLVYPIASPALAANPNLIQNPGYQ
ncbi:MAG: RagB/SusD family nutrient uptake outer membrane protein [Bacteroidota bacterium]|nr:RagB/SusD family nutrient uptake outer membrane protein [Bacteroidota bacterium]MDP4211810.1 RagB/SusD family nutrient uptake outer membrane protein [Bacteroidota bacterium]MDP4251074.1 RagB/SusD family nutrient uptake outer membrane protein [Bacteroidota bacterium]